MYEVRTKIADDQTITVAALRNGNVDGFLLGKLVDGVPVVLSDSLPPDAKQQCLQILKLVTSLGRPSDDGNNLRNILMDAEDAEADYF